MKGSKPHVVVCAPAFNEEGRMGAAVVGGRSYVDGVVVCDDGSVDLTGAIVGGWGLWWCGMSGILGYSAYDINNSVLTNVVGKGNV